MPRNDSKLYSGLTAPIRRERLVEKESHTKLDGKAEMVLDELARLKAEAMNITNIVTDAGVADEVKLRKIERMRERYDDLTILERRMQKLLGVPVSRGKA